MRDWWRTREGQRKAAIKLGCSVGELLGRVCSRSLTHRVESQTERDVVRNVDINVKKGREWEASGEPLIAWCYLGAVGGGWWWQRRWRSSWKRKRDWEEGTALFPFKSPRGRFGTVMMGWGSVWVGVWCCYLPPMYQPPTPPPPPLFLTHTHVRDLYAHFVQDGDGQAGPLRRVCPAGCAHLMCVCV